MGSIPCALLLTVNLGQERMNFHLWARRLSGRATCTLKKSARLTSNARVLNASGSSEKILIDEHSVVESELFIFGHGGRIDIGKWCYLGPNTRIWSAAHISIGDRVLISHSVNIFDSLTHPISPRLRHAQFRAISLQGHPKVIDLSEAPVVIEDDAWIGAGAFVLRGVRVGARSIVGAGSVVTRDIPPDTIVAGNPAVAVRCLTPEELE